MYKYATEPLLNFWLIKRYTKQYVGIQVFNLKTYIPTCRDIYRFVYLLSEGGFKLVTFTYWDVPKHQLMVAERS